jgi:ubiquinone/menaquinone biosynthesis C-methylase UbiE
MNLAQWYSESLFPPILDYVMDSRSLHPYRAALLSEVEGDILEIGFGTGLNLPFYPEQTGKITTIDVNQGMRRIADPRIAHSRMAVDFRILDGANLPMPDNFFDTVVSSWTLCSIARVDKALAEIRRVLKPGGKFVFVEHGRSEHPTVAQWQDRLTPIQKILADGCHLNRDMEKIVGDSGLAIDELQRFIVSRWLGSFSTHYRGVAIKVA